MTIEIGDSLLIDTWAATGTKVEPDDTKKDLGWQLGEKPPREYMNFIQNEFGQKINHILQNGVPVWNATTTYEIGDFVSFGGNLYSAITQNTNSQPPSLNWTNKTELTVPDVNATFYGVTTNVGNAYSVTTDPAFGAPLRVGQLGFIVFNAANSSTSVTLNVNSTGAVNVRDESGASVQAGYIEANRGLGVVYTGTEWRVFGHLRIDATLTTKGILFLASTAECLAGTDNAKAVTPSGLQAVRAAVEALIPIIQTVQGTPGRMRISNILIQWGKISGANTASVTSFATAFSGTPYAGFVTLESTSITPQAQPHIRQLSSTQIFWTKEANTSFWYLVIGPA